MPAWVGDCVGGTVAVNGCAKGWETWVGVGECIILSVPGNRKHRPSQGKKIGLKKKETLPTLSNIPSGSLIVAVCTMYDVRCPICGCLQKRVFVVVGAVLSKRCYLDDV